MKIRYQKNSPTISKTIGDELILLRVKDNVGDLEKVYIVKGTGRRIWELIDGKRSVGEIKRLLIREFKVTPREAEDDLVLFLNQKQSPLIIQ